MRTVDLITRKRDGEELSSEELAYLVQGYMSGAIPDYQMSAFLMATFHSSMTEKEVGTLTDLLLKSGQTVDFSDIPGLKVDKHSTGGVGDKTSLIAAPIAAAAGVTVPMISGRGLGHTGGTLDKIEAIPGVTAQISEERLRAVVGEVGCAIVGATGRIAPADRRLYAIRDVTGTVESIDLITASILSKKLAAGLEALVLDVKCGSGAFMKTETEARALAEALVTAANGAGCRTAALITDMDEPLCPALGNAVEVALCMEILSGNRAAAPRLHDLTVALGGRLLALIGGAEGEGEEKIRAALDTGQAMERFARMVAALGGPPDMAEDWRTHLPAAPVIGEVLAREAGFVTAFDGEALGLVVVAMGGGRRVETDRIDPAVGLTDVIRLGARVEKGQPLATIHARDDVSAETAAVGVLRAIRIGPAPPALPRLVRDRVG